MRQSDIFTALESIGRHFWFCPANQHDETIKKTRKAVFPIFAVSTRQKLRAPFRKDDHLDTSIKGWQMAEDRLIDATSDNSSV